MIATETGRRSKTQYLWVLDGVDKVLVPPCNSNGSQLYTYSSDQYSVRQKSACRGVELVGCLDRVTSITQRPHHKERKEGSSFYLAL